MPSQVTLYLRPTGFTTSSKEAFRLSILDVVVPPNYNNYAIIFRAEDIKHTVVSDLIIRAIEATLQQCRHLLGRIQPNEYGDYSIVNTAQSAVKLVLNWLDDDQEVFPSYAHLEANHFTLASMSNHKLLRVAGMPDSSPPSEHPAVVAFQLNFIKGGFILTTHVHHFALDMTGTYNVLQQLAKNCKAIVGATSLSSLPSCHDQKPEWGDEWMDRSRFMPLATNAEDQCDAPPRPPRHPDWRPCSWVLFYLAPRALQKLKEIASATSSTRISVYDAVAALCWRIVVRNRVKIYGGDLNATAIFGQPMDVRRRCIPQVPAGYQGNALTAGLSMTQPEPLAVRDIIDGKDLATIASFIRSITESVGQHSIDETIAKISPIRNKANLDFPLDALPPLSFSTTDWRSAKLAHLDFGIGQPMAYRCLYDAVVENMMVLYPAHKGTGTEEGGIEVMLPIETEAVQQLLDDSDVRVWFEYRGVEV